MEKRVTVDKDFNLSESEVNDLMGLVISTLNDVYGITILSTHCDAFKYKLEFTTKKEVTREKIFKDILIPSFQTTFATSITQEDWKDINEDIVAALYGNFFSVNVLRTKIRIECGHSFSSSTTIFDSEEEEA